MHVKTFISGSKKFHNNISSKVSFVFPGQGSQYVGMANELYRNFGPAKDLFDNASAILGYDLQLICAKGPQEKLNATVAIFVASMAALEKFKHDDPGTAGSCSLAMGLSLGEYSALCFAGAFSFEEGVRLTMARGEAMQSASNMRPGGMLGLSGVTQDDAQLLCSRAAELSGEEICIGNYLSASKFALSGTVTALDAAQQLVSDGASGRSASAVRLAVAGAFHTQLMGPARSQLEDALRAANIAEPMIPVLANVDSSVHSCAASIREKLVAQLVCPVQWSATMYKVVSDPTFECAYEVGPGRVCAGILKSVSRRVKIVNISV